jgi:hypothetical protein
MKPIAVREAQTLFSQSGECGCEIAGGNTERNISFKMAAITMCKLQGELKPNRKFCLEQKFRFGSM